MQTVSTSTESPKPAAWSPKPVFVAALAREIAAQINHAQRQIREHSSRTFHFYESNHAIFVIAGIGSEAARRAAEAAIVLYTPGIIYSIGFAGAADPSLKIGDIVFPAKVVDARDSSVMAAEFGNAVLVTYNSIASPEQKSKFREAYGATAIDMEAAAVAKAAAARGVRFAAIKAISDAADSQLPSTGQFVNVNGDFRTAAFIVHTIFRPWMWPKVIRLARGSAVAARSLSKAVDQIITSHSQPE